MREVIAKFLKKVFDIREGEIVRASLMQLNIFLVITTLLIVKPTVNGLFLSEIGIEQLPAAFVLVAVFAVIISTLYARFLGRAPLNRLILITLSVSIFLFLLFGIFLRLNVVGGWVLYAFYIWVAIFAVLTASQFWILANVVFNVREAKRLFGFIGAGAIAGGIFGGYLTTLLAEWIGSENLLFVAAGFLFLCIPINSYIWEKSVLRAMSKFQRRKRIPRTEHPFMIIKRSPHLTYLAGIIGISVIVAKLVEYQFNAIASAQIDDPDELTAFFGLWFSNFNVISLTVQLLLTRRIVGTLGVGTSLLFLPMSIFLGAIFIFFAPAIWAAIFIKMSDASLKQSVNKAAVELLSLPVPSEIKNQTKTFIDVVVDSIATGIGGLILIFLVNGLELSTRFISLMIISLIVLWFYFVLRIRKSYLQSFRLNVQQAHKNGDGNLDLKNESVISDLKKVIETGSENQILYILKKLKAQPDARFAQNFLDLLSHPSDQVKEEAIRNLYFLRNYDYTEEINPLINYPSQNVKIAAFDYLIARSIEDDISLMERYLNEGDYRMQLAALISLAEESRDNGVLKVKFELEKRLAAAYQALENITDPQKQVFHKIGLLKALGMSRIQTYFSIIEGFFGDDNKKVATQALLSAGDTLHPYFIPLLIQNLGNMNLAESAQTALVKYGREIIPILDEYTQSENPKVEIVRMIPSVIMHFGTQATADLLFQLLQYEDSGIRLAALRSLNKLKITHPYLNFYKKEVLLQLYKEARWFQDMLSILYVQQKVVNQLTPGEQTKDIQSTRQSLVTLLEIRLDANLERIFRLLGLKYPPEDVISVFESIHSKQPDLRINALEYLDNLLDPGLKKVLIPLVETAILDAISEETIRELNVKIPDEEECYQLLLSEGDDEIREKVQELLQEQ